ncbi:MAG: IS110 family transposase [Defluviitaleaceae bacterium]|nr:IS110 family transposase [Defluviitaleaceae bacterium]
MKLTLWQNTKHLLKPANSAATFGHFVSSNAFQIRSYVSFIKHYDEAISAVLLQIRELIDIHSDKEFVRQIRLIESIPGAGFLTAVTVIAEICDFSVFTSLKQLFAFFGLDPAVKQSGKFVGTQVKMSKKGNSVGECGSPTDLTSL